MSAGLREGDFVRVRIRRNGPVTVGGDGDYDVSPARVLLVSDHGFDWILLSDPKGAGYSSLADNGACRVGGWNFVKHADGGSDRALFDRLADLAVDLLPGRTLLVQGKPLILDEPGRLNGSPGWWLKGSEGFITFANMIAVDARVVVDPEPQR